VSFPRRRGSILFR